MFRMGWVWVGSLCLITALLAACLGEGTGAGMVSAASTEAPDGAVLDCPDMRTVLQALDESTYALVLEEITGLGPADHVHHTIGTAFAVAPLLLVSNAHVAGEEVMRSMPLSRVLAVQSGTGRVVEVVQAFAHPGYNGDPLGSPDVALFTVETELSTFLPIADAARIRDLHRGDQLVLAGFPGDVDALLPVAPGLTVPQATSLSGAVSALRNYSQSTVTPDTVDYIQHQAPTTPGTSGSALVSCGQVVGVNNAGTVRLVVAVGPEGDLRVERQPAGNNNFGVHARHLLDVLALFAADESQGFALPPPFMFGPSEAGDAAAGEEGSDGPSGPTDGTTGLAGTYSGSTVHPAGGRHRLRFTLNDEGELKGNSFWSSATFGLSGEVQANGEVYFEDDAADFGYKPGYYRGLLELEQNRIVGQYFEPDSLGPVGDWAVERQPE